MSDKKILIKLESIFAKVCSFYLWENMLHAEQENIKNNISTL